MSPLRRPADLLTAAGVVTATAIFFLAQVTGVQRAAEARFSSRAMHLGVRVAGAALVISNLDSAAFRECRALVNRRYRSGSFFLAGPGIAGESSPVRLNLVDFHAGERALDPRGQPLQILEISCSDHAEVAGEHAAHGALPDALPWTAEPTRWVGRL